MFKFVYNYTVVHFKAVLSTNLFICPGCKSPISEKLKEHTHCKDSVIHEHINLSEQFLYIVLLINLQHTLHDLNILPLESLILDNCVIIDKSKHWSLVLYQ